jgi:hypothetical protein
MRSNMTIALCAAATLFVGFFAEPFVAACSNPLRGSLQIRALGFDQTVGIALCPDTPAGSLIARWTGANHSAR